MLRPTQRRISDGAATEMHMRPHDSPTHSHGYAPLEAQHYLDRDTPGHVAHYALSVGDLQPKGRTCALSKPTIIKLAGLAGLLVVIIVLYHSLDLATIQSYVAYYREHRAVGLPLFLCLNTVLVMLFCPGGGCYQHNGLAAWRLPTCSHKDSHLPRHAMSSNWLAFHAITQLPAHACCMLHQSSTTLRATASVNRAATCPGWPQLAGLHACSPPPPPPPHASGHSLPAY